MTRRWTYHRHTAATGSEVDRFVKLADAAGPALPVPSCPGWVVADLVRHHGTTHRWMRHLLDTRATARVWSGDIPLGLPGDPAGYPAWLAEGADALLGTLRGMPADTPVWTWGPGGTARFHARRVLHEATVHRADLELAMGADPLIDGDVAVDGIDEFLTNLPHADWVERSGHGRGGAVLRLAAGTVGWTVTLTPDGFRWSPADRPADATVRGSAGDLLLLLYGRRRAADLDVTGDPAPLERWLATLEF